MEDIFVEQLVRRHKDGMYYLKVVMILLAGVITMLALGTLLLAVPSISFLIPILFAGLVYGIYWLISSMNLEFEYIVTNGELDVDCIMNRRRRRRLFSGRAKDFDVMARVASDEYIQAERDGTGPGGRSAARRIDCTAVPGHPDNWFFIANYRSERVLVTLSPNEKILESLYRFSPRTVRYRPERQR